MRALDAYGDCVCATPDHDPLTCPHCAEQLLGRPALAAEHKRACHAREAAWNLEHDLTATCQGPDCERAIKNDGREFCSHGCYRRSRVHVV